MARAVSHSDLLGRVLVDGFDGWIERWGGCGGLLGEIVDSFFTHGGGLVEVCSLRVVGDCLGGSEERVVSSRCVQS